MTQLPLPGFANDPPPPSTEPVTQAVVDAGAPPPAPTAPATEPRPVEPRPIDPRLAQLEAENQRYRQQAALAELNGQAASYAAQLEQAGWLPEHAAAYAQLWARDQASSMRQAETNQLVEAHAKMIVVDQLAKRYGVPSDVLAGYSTPQTMEAAAARYAAETKRISALEAELAKLKGATVPPQMFAQPGGAAPGVATPDNIDKLYMDHERARPNQPNPYEAAYRKLLGL